MNAHRVNLDHGMRATTSKPHPSHLLFCVTVSTLDITFASQTSLLSLVRSWPGDYVPLSCHAGRRDSPCMTTGHSLHHPANTGMYHTPCCMSALFDCRFGSLSSVVPGCQPAQGSVNTKLPSTAAKSLPFCQFSQLSIPLDLSDCPTDRSHNQVTVTHKASGVVGRMTPL
jgi:hypothetical protein